MIQMIQPLAEFVESYPVKHFAKGEIVIYQGETPSSVYVVKSGFVKAYDINSDGTEQLIWLGARLNSFPIVYFEDMMLRPAVFFYGAFTDLDAYCIDSESYARGLKTDHRLLFEMYALMSHNLSDYLERLSAVEKPKASDKIIYTLDFLASRFGGTKDGDDIEVALPLTHQDIANLVGLTRETTAMELKKLKDQGYIHYDKWRFSINRQKLKKLLR